jgi:hypothetical protein
LVVARLMLLLLLLLAGVRLEKVGLPCWALVGFNVFQLLAVMVLLVICTVRVAEVDLTLQARLHHVLAVLELTELLSWNFTLRRKHAKQQ